MTNKNLLINSVDKELIMEHLYTVEGYLTFEIGVKSGKFAGTSNFCIPSNDINSIIEKLSKMHNKLNGCCEIKDYDSDAHISIEMDKLGHMFICGQIGGSHEEHFMRFKYFTDQSVLGALIKILKAEV